MAKEIRHMAIGLQSSGKTTFAAALWYLVDSKEIVTSLRKGKHSGDYRYLELLAAEWADCWRVPRTLSEQHENIVMNLEDQATGQAVVLQFVDLPGETFERAFATRQVSRKVADAFEGIRGLMLFVSAGQPRDDVTLLDVAKTLSENADEDKLVEEAIATVNFDPAKTPRQVQIVDFLQAIQAPPMEIDVQRVALIVSAWDKAINTDPAAWLHDKMPLLDQYLSHLKVEVRVYGVSAQGGDVPEKGVSGDEGDRQALLSVAKASERIQVVGNGVDQHDLTHPVRWLSDLEGL
ncbi:hypothetical protein [Mesorhizobium sp. M1B.F.Ca.ET.045.04.1.1]|uniref:TRAFAC clade GTPase domain-containing protein n=1 Tax=Mesorhizobium sp. M1B.F.Ca.ET.045.04.1.1 TaxID=2493673 RepID=UPI000F757755|nr:hypothetical protein [Mesorhizobium sp. M1B.F.Ca.ET.045.04.1.1]AZO30809.1 hypothetical protein EJ071_27710 [Mesorhizobium sp. M1B.F.Ca.ET.045.04.1.1]